MTRDLLVIKQKVGDNVLYLKKGEFEKGRAVGGRERERKEKKREFLFEKKFSGETSSSPQLVMFLDLKALIKRVSVQKGL